MKILTKLTVVILAFGLLAGCAGQNQRMTNNNLFCALAGGAVGGAMGAAASASTLGGAGVGAMLAVLLCQEGDDAVAEPMPVEVAACTDTPPPGALLDAQGCAFDSDKDGIVDGVDLCANTPTGVTVDRVGCALDSDKDGVADYKDLCPATPLGTIVDPDGCPLPGQNLLSLTGVNFDTNKSALTSSAKEILEEAITLLKKTDAVIEVRVEGHTDSRGTEAHNMALSQRRAEAVAAYLSSQGVNTDSLIPVGMGESAPIANNNTVAGQAANRRVDFVVIQ